MDFTRTLTELETWILLVRLPEASQNCNRKSQRNDQKLLLTNGGEQGNIILNGMKKDTRDRSPAESSYLPSVLN